MPRYEACDFTIYGVLGDLSRRKLIPSIYQLDKAGLLHPDTKVIGVARHDLSQEAFVDKIKESLETFVKKPLDPDVVKRLLDRIVYVLVNLDTPEEYKRLAENTDQTKRVLVNYFSVAPSLFDDICKGLDYAGLITDETRVVLEKPFGRDLESSREIIVHIKSEEKQKVYEPAISEGPLEEMPIRYILRQEKVPVMVYWAP